MLLDLYVTMCASLPVRITTPTFGSSRTSLKHNDISASAASTSNLIKHICTVTGSDEGCTVLLTCQWCERIPLVGTVDGDLAGQSRP